MSLPSALSGEPSALGLAHQSIDDGEKGRERLARCRRGRDEGVPAFQDRGPSSIWQGVGAPNRPESQLRMAG